MPSSSVPDLTTAAKPAVTLAQPSAARAREALLASAARGPSRYVTGIAVRAMVTALGLAFHLRRLFD